MDEKYCKKLVADCWPDLRPKGAIGGNEMSSIVFSCDVMQNGKENLFVPRQVVKVILVEVTKSDEQQISTMGVSYDAFYKDKVQKALQEVEIMRNLMNQPNIVRINDFGKFEVQKKSAGTDEMHLQTYILIRMDQMTDCTDLIQDYAMRPAQSAEKFAIKLAGDILNALSICNYLGLIHRDIKPQNIFYVQTGDHITFMLGDFGVSRSLPANSRTLTTAGTALYISPEINGGKPADARADLYSLGIVLYQIVNHNRLPLTKSYKDGPLTPGILDAALSKRLIDGAPLPDPDNCSKEFASFVKKLCAFRSEDRFASADEALKTLRLLQAGTVPHKEVQPHVEEKTETKGNPSATPGPAPAPHIVFANTKPSTKQPGRSKGIARGVIPAMIALALLLLYARITIKPEPATEDTEQAATTSAVLADTTEEEADAATTMSEEEPQAVSTLSDTESAEETLTAETTELSEKGDSDEPAGTVMALENMSVINGYDCDSSTDVYDKIGNHYQKALWLWGRSYTYKLDGKYQRFVSLVSCLDATNLSGSDIEIYFDNSNQPAATMHIDIDMEPEVLDVDVSGVDEITIVHNAVSGFDKALLVDAAFYTDSADADQKIDQMKKDLAVIPAVKDTPMSSMQIIGIGSDKGESNITAVHDAKDTLGNYYREAMRLDGDTAEYYIGGRYKRFIGWLSCCEFAYTGADLSVYVDKSNNAAFTLHMDSDMEPTLIDIDLTDAKYVQFNFDVHNNYINSGILSDAMFYTTDEAADAAIAAHDAK